MTLSPIDKAALERAVETTRNESAARRRQVDSFLSSQDWLDTAMFCAGCAQSRSLRLMPWQPSPCTIDDIASALDIADETRGYRAAAQLLQRMERCGVSRWHPDPVAASEAAEAQHHQTAK